MNAGNHLKIFIVLSVLLARVHVFADFTQYQVILDRKPFGEIKIEPKPVADPKTSFAKNLEIRSIVSDNQGLRVSFHDSQANETFRLRLNESYSGITLISADYDDEEAVLRKGMELCKFSLKDEKTTSVASANQTPPLQPAMPGQQRSNFSSDPNMANPLARRRAARQPIARGETIENFLKNNPEAASQFPSPIRPFSQGDDQQWPPPSAVGRGETIEKFLRENPEAISQYPSPIRPPAPGEAAAGRGETIEQFMINQEQTTPQYQIPSTMQLTDEHGNIVPPSGIMPDGTPYYDFPETE